MMELSQEHLMLQDMVRQFVATEVEPVASELDEQKRFPDDIMKKMAKLGLLGIPFPEEYGGAGMDTLAFAIAVEELARSCGSTAITLCAHISLGAYPIYTFGNEDQKKKYLPGLCSGEYYGAFGLTEPDAGSDAGGIKTKAEKKNGRWILNGSKIYITNGGKAKVIVTSARSDPNAKKHKGISTFIVESDYPGFKVGKLENKLGLRASNTSELIYENCEVPAENLVGNEGDGFKQALMTLDEGRIVIGAMALGIAQGAYDRSREYAKQRIQFGKPISELQAIQSKIADMATEIEAARLLVYQAAWLKDQNKPFSKLSAMCKLFASEVAMRVTNQAIQIHGGYGFIKDYPVERYYRDAKLTTIGEGTSEIQRLVIARNVLKE
jgi:alkylation response protein AidB-like acyl-CoA dehydrogenase